MKVTITSDKTTPEVETILQKALTAFQSPRENRPFEPPLQKHVQSVDIAVDKVLNNMINELVEAIEEMETQVKYNSLNQKVSEKSV